MSNGDNELRAFSAAILPCVNLDAVRALLRKERKARKWSLDDLADKAGVNRTTIQDIETNPKGVPRFETIARLIEAMPPLTLSKFFSLIEGQTNTDLPPSGHSVTTDSIRSGTKQGGAGVTTPFPASDIDIKSIVSALGVTAIEVLERAVDRGFDRLAAEQARPTPRRQPHRRPLRRKAG